jgi:hypothetical protein
MVYPGAVISRPKAGLRHWGVLLSDYRVVHCAPLRGEHITSAEDFAAGEDITFVRMLVPAAYSPTMRRIAESLRNPKAYHAVTNNCQTFANRMVGAEPDSPDLKAIVALLVVAAFVGVAAAR